MPQTPSLEPVNTGALMFNHRSFGELTPTEDKRLLAMLKEARATNQHLYFDSSAVAQMMTSSGKLKPDGVQALSDLFDLATRTKSSYSHMLQYVSTISAIIRSIEPCNGTAFGKLLAKNKEQPQSITEIHHLIKPLIEAISRRCFDGRADYESSQWIAAGQALVATEKHLIKIEQFDPAAALRELAEEALEHESIISGEASTVMAEIRELVKDQLPAGVTLSHEETESRTTEYHDIDTYRGVLTINLHVGPITAPWMKLKSDDSYSSSPKNSGGPYDEIAYHYSVKKDKVLAKLKQKKQLP